MTAPDNTNTPVSAGPDQGSGPGFQPDTPNSVQENPGTASAGYPPYPAWQPGMPPYYQNPNYYPHTGPVMYPHPGAVFPPGRMPDPAAGNMPNAAGTPAQPDLTTAAAGTPVHPDATQNPVQPGLSHNSPGSAPMQASAQTGTASTPIQPAVSENPQNAAPAQTYANTEAVSSTQAQPDAPEEQKQEKPSDTPQLVTHMVEPHKNNNVLILALTGLVMVIVICGTLMFMASASGKSGSVATYQENRNFLVLSSVPVVKSVGSDVSNGKLQAGQTVLIRESLTSTDGKVWGMIGEDMWVLLSDHDYMYLIDQSLVSYETEKEEKTYTAQKDTYVYSIPGGVSEPISSITKDDKVYVLEVVDLESGKWGRIGLNQWVLMEKDGSTILALDQDEEQEDEKDDKDEEKDDEEEENKGSYLIGSFETGVYELDYDMIIRRSPSFDGEEVKSLPAGTLVKVAWLKKIDARNSIWGELDNKGSGYWICLRASGTTYLRWVDPDEPAVRVEQEITNEPENQNPDINQNPSQGSENQENPPQNPDEQTPEPQPEPGSENQQPAVDPNAPEGPIVQDDLTPAQNTDDSQDSRSSEQPSAALPRTPGKDLA